jgi:hypothetical protein
MLQVSPEEFARLVAESKSWSNIVFHLGKSGVLGKADKRFVNILKKKCLLLRLDTSHFWGKKKSIISDDMLREITRESTSLQQVINKCQFGGDQETRNKLRNRLIDLDISTTHFKIKQTYPRKVHTLDAIDDEKLRSLVSECCYWSTLAQKCGYRYWSKEVKSELLRRITLIGIDTSHYTTRRKTNAETFVEHNLCHGQDLIKRLVKSLNWPYVCNSCNNKHFVEEEGVLLWNNKPVKLQLEHKNGIHHDNRLENLEFLCPNCHTQTSTFCGKNTSSARSVKSWIQDNDTEPSSSSP